MLIRSYMSVAAFAFAFTVASAASAVEITNGLSTNGFASSVTQFEAATLQDGSVIPLAQ